MKNKVFLGSLFSSVLANLVIFFSHQKASLAFLLYLLSIFLGFLGSGFFKRLIFLFKKTYFYSDSKIPFLTLLALFLIHFFLLGQIPFVLTGDQVRDGGLNARQILFGEIDNPFDYGRYCSHGLIIPSLIIPFYLIFPNSIYAYRVSAALLGFFGSVLMSMTFFQLPKFRTKKLPPFFLFLLLAFLSTQPHYLFYSRTEVVVAFTFFLSSLLMLWSFWLLNQKKPGQADLFVLGLLAGLSFNFHASLRPFAILLTGMVLLILAKKDIGNIANLLYCFLGLGLGFGPKIWLGSSSCFFHISRWSHQPPVILINRYLRSLSIYLGSFVSGFCPFSRPIIPLFLVPIFFYGVKHLLSLELGKVIISLLIIIPFTNSAFTDMINAPHRLAPLYPLIAITLFWGLWQIMRITSNQKSQILSILLIFLVGAAIIDNISQIFLNRLFDKYQLKERLTVSRLIRDLKSFGEERKICLLAGPILVKNLNLMHNQEALSYFFPSLEIKIISSKRMGSSNYQLIRCFGELK